MRVNRLESGKTDHPISLFLSEFLRTCTAPRFASIVMERQSLLQSSAPDEIHDLREDSIFHSESSVELSAMIPEEDDNGKDSSSLQFRMNDLAPDQFDPKYEASTAEFWAYCLWFIGNSSMSLCQFAPVAFQNLLNQAAGSAGILRFLGR